MTVLRQSTARTVLVGPVLDSTGAAKTDEVVANIKLTKNGTVGAANGSATLTHDHAGKYLLALTTSDTDTVGVLEVSLSSGTNDMPVARFNVVAEVVFDSLFAASAAGYQVPIWSSAAATVTLSNTTINDVTTKTGYTASPTAGSIVTASFGACVAPSGFIVAESIATGAITNAKFAAGAIDAAAIANGAIDAATFAADVDAEILSYLVDDATRIDASALNTATVTTIPAILADTGTDGVVVAAASKTGYTLTATTGLGNQTANITGNLSGSVGSVTGAVGSVTGAVGSVTGNVGGNVVGSVGSVSGDTKQTADVATLIATVGAAGAGLTALASAANLATVAGYLDTEIQTIIGYVDCLPETWVVPGTLTAAQVRTELATELGRIDAAVSTRQATVANLVNTVTMAAQFATMVVLDGTVYDFTVAALAAAPSGSGLDAAGVRAALGMAAADLDTQLDGIAADAATAAGASGGSGARTVAITVNDGTTALESARVRVTKGALSYALSTSEAGLATFNLDDGTWTVAITLAGYTYAGTTLVVNGDEAATYSMTANSFTPSTRPGTVTLRYTVIDDADYLPCGVGEGTVYIRMISPPTANGFAWGSGERSATTDANGVAEFTDVPVGCKLLVRLGSAAAKQVTIPSDATSPYDGGEIVGYVP